LLVVHEKPQTDDAEKGEDAEKERVDWTFEIWRPRSFHQLFSHPKGSFPPGNSNHRQPVPAPKIDLYVGGGCPVDWQKVKVPASVRVIDTRTEEGGVLRGGVYDMASHQLMSGVEVILEKQVAAREWEEEARTKTDASGRFELRAASREYYRLLFESKGYVSRRSGGLDNKLAHASHDRDTFLSKEISLCGIVTDQGGKPIPDVKVTARDTLGIDGLAYESATKLSTTTDADGVFELQSLPEGFTRIQCHAPPLRQETSSHEIYGVPTRDRDGPKPIKIVMMGTGVVQGRVLDRRGKPPTREFIAEIEPKGGRQVGSWAGTEKFRDGGVFEFKGVPTGVYKVLVKPNPMREDEASLSQEFGVSAGKTVKLEFVSDRAHKKDK
jgi:hypothetical protein